MASSVTAEKKQERNPYALSFGRIPNRFINRSLVTDTIVETLNSDIVTEQAFKLTGIRGTGKTVTLSAIVREMEQDRKWVVVNLKSGGEITGDLVANLYSEIPFLTKYVDANLNLSAFGIGLNISKKSPVASLDAALKMLLKEIQKQKKRLLITIDEVHKTDAIVDFIQEFQILIREELPVYLIVAGLYEDVESVENTDGLTFFLRAETFEMTPLNLKMIRDDYRKTLRLDAATADALAEMTKGYAFAYQAFGKYMWESKSKTITDEVLMQADEALSKMVYEKIWSELAPRDRWFLRYLAQKDKMTVEELLETTKKKHNEWSEPRKRLADKGIIDVSVRGKIAINLPRLKEFVESRQE